VNANGALEGVVVSQVTGPVDIPLNTPGVTFQGAAVGVSVGRQPGVAPSSDPQLVVTLRARVGCGAIDHIQFGEPGSPFDNAQLSMVGPAGGPTNQTSGFIYTPPPRTTSVSLVIQRVAQRGGATVSPIKFYDGCGEWRTFVGGGPDAFR